MSDNKYDVIIIGSGIGGMTAANLLAKIGKKKVLVLEQHWEPGGLTHEFKRKGKFHWDVGIHYVGKLQPGSLDTQVLDFISEGEIKWNDMPYMYDVFHYPGLDFSVPSDKDDYKNKLITLFPEESNSIKQYFKDINKVAIWYIGYIAEKMTPPFIGFFINLFNKVNEALALCTTGDYMEKRFKSHVLRSLLVSQWGDYGLPPRTSSFLIHSIIANHYLRGAVYPEGGASEIFKSLNSVLEKEGGIVKTSIEAKEVIIEDNQVKGVIAIQKRGEKITEKYYAPIVISSTGASHTYSTLLKNKVSDIYEMELKKLRGGMSATTLYLGLKEHPGKLGFKGENHWIYSDFNHDELTTRNSILDGKPDSCFLSFPSLKTTNPKGHTAEIISFTHYDSFEK